MVYYLRRTLVLSMILSFFAVANAQENELKSVTRLTHQMTPDEMSRRNEIGKSFVQTDPPTGDITSIAEFDRAVGTVIAYSGGFGIPMSLIRELAKDAKLTTLVPSASAQSTVINLYTQARVNLDNCEFMIIPTNSYWSRDWGPMYVTYGANQIGIVDFPYNRPRPEDDEAPKLMAENLGIPWFGMPVTHTGGNYMTDGYGFASSTTIAYTENPELTPAQVDQHMQSYLGIDDYSVLEDPNNTYIDHIDCWGKYLGPDKVLIRSVPTSHPQYDEIEATAAYYANKTSMYGTPYKVYRVFTPQNQPYTNSYIQNDKVFVPIMNSQYDDDALQAYRDAMPGYKVFGFIGQPSTPWESTDALHCRAHEMADLGMLYLKHIPLQGNVDVQSSYSFVAYAKPFGGQQVLSDSVIMYYRVNPNPMTPYTPLNMTNTMGNTWTANITAPAEGSTVEYYIFAADNTGRREFQPFIGAADAFKFNVGSQMEAQAAVSPSSFEFTAMKDTEDTQTLTINNTGQNELNYTIGITTDINDTLSFNLNNSPAPTAWNSNTLTEENWTTFAVSEEAEVSNVVLSYQWNADEYYEEGSIWIQSPAGTTFRAGYQQVDGNYKVTIPSFTGEPMNGNWKVWLQDSFGDGGHQATNVSVKIIKDNTLGNWLTVNNVNGTLPAGNTGEILVTANAQDMEIGSYEGRITFYSNDPDEPAIEIPVTFNVTINISAENEELTAEQITVNPNPFNDVLKVSVNFTKESTISLELYNTNGRRVYSNEQSVSAGPQQISIPSANLPQGVYLLKVNNGIKAENFKLVKGK